MSNYNLKFTSKQGLEFIKKHYDFAIMTNHWTLKRVVYDTSDNMSCDICGHKPIRYLFFVAPQGREAVYMVGSICIDKWFNFSHLDKSTLRKLRKELNEYAKLFRLSKDSNEWKNKALELSELRTMKQQLEQEKRDKEQAERDKKRKNQRVIYEKWLSLEDLSLMMFNDWEQRFYNNTVEWFANGRSWTSKQLATINKIIAKYQDVTQEEIQDAKQDFELYKEDLAQVEELRDCKLWSKHAEFIDSVHYQLITYQNPLTERQKAYVDTLTQRYSTQIKRAREFKEYLNTLGDTNPNDISLF